MSVEFKLYCKEEDMYKNKSMEERNEILYEMVLFAIKYGIKPAARKYNTCPKTVRKWVNRYKENGKEAIKVKK